MKTESNVQTNEPFHQKLWLMYLLLIVFPPAGIVFIWLQRSYTNTRKIILTILAALYFILLPIILIVILVIIWNPTNPLYYNHDDFIEAFEYKVDDQDLSYEINITDEEKHLISSELAEDISLLENLDSNGEIQELVMIGQGTGMDNIRAIGFLIEVTNPDLEKEEVGQVLEDLHLFDDEFPSNKGASVDKNRIYYHLSYDESTGVVFSISKVNN